MITITYKSGHQWKYKGELELRIAGVDNAIVIVSGGSILTSTVEPYQWVTNYADGHFLSEIEKIEGATGRFALPQNAEI